MASATSILPEKLHEYPQQDVIDGSTGSSASILDDCLNQNDGVLQLMHRYAGRTFCSPGKRLRLDEESYHPDYMGGTGLDEIWMGCTVPIVTGVIDTRTGKAPYREGESHVLTPGGQVISLQDLIAANPETVMGEKDHRLFEGVVRGSNLADCVQEIRQFKSDSSSPSLVQVGSLRYQFF